MLPSAHLAISAIALVVVAFSPRSRMSCSAAARMWARVPVTASSVAIGGRLLVVIADVAAYEERRDDGGEDQEADGHEQADVDGVDERVLYGTGERGVGSPLGVPRRGAGAELGHDPGGLRLRDTRLDEA